MTAPAGLVIEDNRTRIAWIDMAKGVGVFLVILGHTGYVGDDVMRWISSFHMPLFFVIGGILAYIKRGRRVTWAKWLQGKAGGILLPYASFSLMILTFNALTFILYGTDPTLDELLRQAVDAVTLYGVHILWFLPAYFIATAAFGFLIRSEMRPLLRNTLVAALAAAAYVIVRMFGLDSYSTYETALAGYVLPNIAVTVLRGVLAVPFVLMGWYIGAAFDRLSPKKTAACAAGGLLMIPGAWLAYISEMFDLHYLYVSPVNYLSAFLSCAGLICLMRALPESRALTFLGRSSLVIMCTHAAFHVVYYASLAVFFIDNRVPLPEGVFCLLIAVLVCAAEVPVVWVFDNFFGFLIGRRRTDEDNRSE